MSDDHSMQAPSGPESPEGSSPSIPPQARGGLPLVPVLGGVAILLLALWIGLNIRPASPAGDQEKTEIKGMKAELSAAEAELNALRVSMGLRPKQSAYEPIEEVAQRMKKDADSLLDLARTLQSSLAEQEVVISAKNSQIIESEKTRQLLVAELENMRRQLGDSLSSMALVDRYKTESQVMQSRIDALNAEVGQLRDALGKKPVGLPDDEVARWESRLEEANRAKQFLEARLAQMEQQLAKANLFAKSESDLLPAAVELFRSLRKLEGRSETELNGAYVDLGASLGASVLHTLAFETGSSELSATDRERIRAMISELPDGDLLLFVGYASETGNVYQNQELSSARATSAAEFYSGIKQPGQKVQAVYLGQTTRFSKQVPERNQIVEAWRIRAQ